MKNTKICIFGLGGVGGFLAAKLADFYKPNTGNIEISFVARGDTLAAVKEQGIFLSHAGENIQAFPSIVSDKPQEIGEVDFLICAVKACDIDSFISSSKPLIAQNTVLLPFLNGVDGAEKLRKAFPANTVADACVFIVSEIVNAGKIKCSMEKYAYMFGLNGSENMQLKQLEKILKDANIRATYTEAIERIVWEKFAFISPLSTLMSAVQKTFAETMADPNNQKDLQALLAEFCALAFAQKRDVLPSLSEDTYKKYAALMPPDATCSMQRDFAAKKRNELETLCGYIVRNSAALGLDSPRYKKYYKILFAESHK